LGSVGNPQSDTYPTAGAVVAVLACGYHAQFSRRCRSLPDRCQRGFPHHSPLVFTHSLRRRPTFIESDRELFEKTLGDGVTDAEFQLACRQVIFDVERMEQESSEFGMSMRSLQL